MTLGATEAGREEGKTNAAEAGDPTKAKNAEEEQKGEKAQPAAAAAKEAVEKQEEGGNAGPSGNPAPEDAKAGAQGNPAEAKVDTDAQEPSAKKAKVDTDAKEENPVGNKPIGESGGGGGGADGGGVEAKTETPAAADAGAAPAQGEKKEGGTGESAEEKKADPNATATPNPNAANAGAAANAANNNRKAPPTGANNGNNGNQGVGKTGDNMGGQKRAEIYTYGSKDMVYALAWSVRKDKKFRLAAGSFVEEYVNKVDILYLDETKGKLGLGPSALSFNHPFPATKIMFMPEKGTGMPDLLATSSDYLRIYNLDDSKEADSSVEIKSILTNSSNSEFCAPLTSFDWNEDDLNKIGTSSIDTTCTIWDIEKECVDTQLIAHDREVYDIAWGGAGVFASVSADGSVRVFDLRDKEHSTIIYESPHPEVPLVRLGWNKQDPRYMATILMDSSKVIILDIRFPTLPVAELQRHQASVNALAWAPHSSCHICTAGDDAQALIWDLSSMSQPLDGSLDPILAYHAGSEINNLQWSSAQPDWVAIAFSQSVQILRV